MLSGESIDCHVVFAPVLYFQRGDRRKDMAKKTQEIIKEIVTQTTAGRSSRFETVFIRNMPTSSIITSQNSLSCQASTPSDLHMLQEP